MGHGLLAKFIHPNPAIRRELVDLLYTSLPQVMSINAAAITGSVTLAVLHRDPGYIAITFAIVVNAIGRVVSLLRYKQHGGRLSDPDVILWEKVYAAGAAAFGLALGALTFRAFQLNDAPGAWIAFGLSMSYCVGMVSRAAIRPWVVLTTTAVLFAPTLIAGLMRPELPYQLGAAMLVLFWFSIREASRHLSTAFIERLEAKHALARQANHDFLTGLPNRAAFLTTLERTTGSVAIVAIDLDGFKPVNDRHGHHAGDELLRQVAIRLSDCVGSGGLAARFGGDEFMLLRPVAGGAQGRDDALELAREAVRALSMPFLLSDIPVLIGASAGLLVSDQPLTDEAVDELLRRVDDALYVAKRAGGGGCTWAEAGATTLRQAG
ncbi:GGDEF domain-containing protein [Bradyrhizobium aeschynomenes]|uniref:GGDEF domain-containing protein n=1 Tax=Bradyrhizobium aeschynomenes TaxID=2734909 RepID=UPI00155449DD|nr:GGDEF domain-containing protein [Bradyrhizobium aeschynomenes]NPV24562.1 GGDEF domain-containing protein [Bradyrhizobium aeschynomenes]